MLVEALAGRIAQINQRRTDMIDSGKDAIYSKPQQQVDDFRFDQSVAEVFPDMIQRSVPGYNTIIDSIGQIAGQYATDSSNIYEL